MKRKPKVCFIVSSLCNEGPVNVMFNIIRFIDFSRFEISIITLVPEKENSRLKEFKELPVSIYQLCATDKLNPLKTYSLLKKTVQEINPDMLHAHCPRSLYLMYFLPKKYKRIYTIHIYPGLQQEILYGKIKGDIVIRLNNFFTRRIDMPIGCAESVGSQYKEKKGWDITSIPNGCSLPVWKTDPVHKQALRKELGLDDNTKYFIYIGRFSDEKRPGMIVNAFQKLDRQDIGLIMLGNGPLWGSLKEKESKNIILPGFRTNIYEYLIASDYYISASDVEGLPNTLLESMTVGLPVLLSDIPAHVEVLSKTTRPVGLIFDHHNENDLIEKIEAVGMINTEEAEIELKEIFLRFYTAQKMSESYQQTYINMLS